MKSRLWKSGTVWLIAYVAVIGVVIGSLLAARRRALGEMNSPQAQADWEAWRQAVREQAGSGGPVLRRVPTSSEVPMVVLLRDYFGVCLVAAVVFPSLLFGVMMFMLRGVLRGEGPKAVNKKNE